VICMKSLDPQRHVAALEARKPLSGSGQFFAEYAPEPNPATGKKDVVWSALLTRGGADKEDKAAA
jgi:hypothetical protein